MIAEIDELQKKLNADFFNILKTALCLGLIAWLYYLAACEVSYQELAKDCIRNGQVEQFIDGKRHIISCAVYEKTTSTFTETFERVTNVHK